MTAEPRRAGPLVQPIDPYVADGGRDADALKARTQSVNRGAARAAVLGVNDGLVTNLSLIIGMAGASAGQSAVRLAGFASLIAGAFSMAAGEWVSVRSQVELYRGILAELRSLVRRNPRLILEQLTEKLQSDGFGTETAQQAATELPLDEDRFFAFAARTLFGLNAEELGSPRVAAVSSLALFSIGALVPLAPWFFTDGIVATAISIALTAVASVAVGGWITASSGSGVMRGATRQLLIVIATASVTYAIGKVFGTVVA
jgi:vacuolar iron transporter family protein